MAQYKRNLLICFDAFGTLFAPKRPIAQQYAEVATSLGLSNINEDEVQKSFGKAFKRESRLHPNYGKASGMNAEKWQIITNTFQPLLGPNDALPAELAPKLLHRFWSDEGYELQPGASEVFQYLRDEPRRHFDNVVVGLITNSDSRVPDVLTSLGLRVSPLRFGTQPSGPVLGIDGTVHDVEFAVMSYDVGFEKPNKKIFRAAEQMLDPALRARGDTSTSRKPGDWEKIYVGDELDKDVVGAAKAGWQAILISEQAVDDGVKWLEDEPGGNLTLMLEMGCPAVGFGSLYRIAEWLRL